MLTSKDPVSVLIVDDEPLILTKLKRFPWENNGCQLVGSAHSFTSALDIFEKSHPNIIITDIQMPGKSGLELAQIIHNIDANVQFIFITLFSDFTYAKRAITLGATDYLVKGIYTSKDIINALEKAKQRIVACHQNDICDKVDKVQKEMQQLNNYIKNPTKSSKPIFNFPAQVCGVSIRYLDSSSVLFQMSILQYFTTLQESFDGIVDIKYISNSRFDLFLSKTANSSKLLENIQRNFNEQFSLNTTTIFLTDSNLILNVDEYISLHNNINETLNMSFYEENSCILHFYNNKNINTKIELEIQKFQEDIISLQSKLQQLSDYLSNIFIPKVKELHVKPEYIRQFLYLTVTKIERRLGIGEQVSESIKKLSYAKDIKSCVSSFLQCVKHLHITSHIENRFEIQKALEIVRTKMEQSITLTEIAAEVGFSPSYLSYLFKKKLNKNFKDVLLEMRMERAAHLLINSNLKIYEVAQKVGIPNYRYFVSVFNEFYKTTPKKYRGIQI